MTSNIHLNSSETTQMENSFSLKVVLPNVVICVLLTLTLWITISLVHYGVKTGKWRQSKMQNQAEKLNIGFIYTSVVMCGLTAIVFDVATIVYINSGFTSNGYHLNVMHEYCDSIADLADSAYVSVLLATASFLWFRQRIFFRNRLLNINYNKFVKVLSLLSLFLIIVFAIAVLTFYIFPDDHYATVDGCVYKPDKNMKIGHLISIIFGIILSQSMLWGLFVYALKSSGNQFITDVHKKSTCCRHKPLQGSGYDKSVEKTKQNQLSTSQLSSSPSDSTSSQPKLVAITSNQTLASYKKVRYIMAKTLAVAVATTLFDILEVLLVNNMVEPYAHQKFAHMYSSVNMFLHILLVVLSFTQFRKMLTSLCLPN